MTDLAADRLTPAELGTLLQGAFAIANRAVVDDIEDECHFHWEDGHAWYDLRPMTNPNEHSPQAIDMAQQALAWAHATGLLIAHPVHTHLARIAPQAS